MGCVYAEICQEVRVAGSRLENFPPANVPVVLQPFGIEPLGPKVQRAGRSELCRAIKFWLLQGVRGESWTTYREQTEAIGPIGYPPVVTGMVGSERNRRQASRRRKKLLPGGFFANYKKERWPGGARKLQTVFSSPVPAPLHGLASSF